MRSCTHLQRGRPVTETQPNLASASEKGSGKPSGEGASRPWLPGGTSPVLAGALVVALVLLVGGALLTDGFFTFANFRAVMRTSALVGIVAVAMTPVMLSGNYVSLGTQQSAMAAMVVYIAMLGAGFSHIAAIAVVVVGSVLIGVLQAILISAGLNPIITTLAAGGILFGTVSSLSDRGVVRAGGDVLLWGDARVVGIPIDVLCFVVFTIVVSIIGSRTVVGRQILLVGSNRATATVTGISVPRVTIAAFSIFGVGLALAAVLSGAAFGEATVRSFDGLTIDAIAAMLVGGSAIQGGRGSPLRSAVGALIIAVAANLMTLNAFSTGTRLAIRGLIVVSVVVLVHAVQKGGFRR